MKKVVIISLSVVFVIAVCLTIVFSCGGGELSKIKKHISCYDIAVDYNDTTKTLSGKQTLRYINNNDVVLNSLNFHLYPKAFKKEAEGKPVSEFNSAKAYPNGFSEGDMTIESVFVENKSVKFGFAGKDKDILVVPFLDELYPQEMCSIYIEFTVIIPNINFRFGYGENTVNLGNFYPVACKYEEGGFINDSYHYNGDPFYTDIASYNVEVNYPNNIVCVASGKLTNEKSNETRKTSYYSAVAVRDFALCLSTKFNVVSEVVDNTKVNYYYYNDENAEGSLTVSLDAVKTFNNLIGLYPYDELNVVQANFLHGGMEYPSLVLISDDLKSNSEYNNVIVHEIGHQWFYGVVGNNEVKEAWLDEGLTEYITAMFYELNPGYQIKINDIIGNALKSYLLFEEVYRDVYGNIDTSMDRKLNEFATEPEYVYMVYVKGMLLFDAVREQIGDSAFCQSLKYYYETNKFKVATKDHLIAAFQKHTTKDVEGLINSWVNGDFSLSNK